MADIKLTKEQLAATENSGGPLLVSAAAGSGKTRVLVERLMKKVLSGDRYDVDDFLIITYTNAAAAELRGKILDAIYDRIASDPENRRLRRQADKCGRAEIETIHSFCSKIIRENANLLGIAPDFRIADESESGSIKQEILSDLLDEMYETGDAGFIRLADTLGAGRDDAGLVNIILDAHVKLKSHPYPSVWVEEQIDAINTDVDTDLSDTLWGRTIMEKAASWADYWTERLRDAIDEAALYPDFLKAYGPSMDVTFDGMLRVKAGLKSGWDAAAEAIRAVEFPRPKPVAGYDDLKAVRNDLKDGLKPYINLFRYSSCKALEDMKTVAPAMTALLRLVLTFDERYSAEKRRRGVLDFSDQEHLALKLLVDEKTGKPTETAERVSQRFAEIMVDEYQDVNAIQELIFGAVSRNGQNVFMVGDVKQSIYRFRLADPTIFLGKYQSYKDAEDASDGEGRRIILAKNFRSRAGVLEAANFIFRNIMSRSFGEMDYTDREALYPGAEYPEWDEPEMELDVIDLSAGDDEDGDKTSAEAAFAAERILELTSGKVRISDGAGGTRPVRFGDIAILMRSPRSRLPAWTAALAAHGIPVATEPEGGFFSTPEITIAVSLLTVIDNPRQDIPLVSVLRSPIYGFTSEELGLIRADCRDGDFYEAILKRSEDDEKCRAFLVELAALRSEAADMPSDEFIWHVFTKTGLMAAVSAMPGSARRKNNLMLLLELAKKFEAAGYKGLFGFVSYLRKLMERGDEPAVEGASQDENAVTIMTIHKSKGLEFPIVILADTTRRFNTDDSKKPLLIHPKLGVGPKVTDTTRKIEYPSIARNAVKLAINSENMAEELRVLYVAMTRAREKLIVLCTYTDAEKEMARLAGAPLPVPPQLLENGRCMADWMLMAALRREESGPIRYGAENVPAASDGNRWCVRLITGTEDQPGAVGTTENDTADDTAPICTVDVGARLNWKYPYDSASGLPSKLTATELKGGFRREEAGEDAENVSVPEVMLAPPVRPDFLSGKRPLTAAQKGTAAHMVMQFADYDRCVTVKGAAEEIERLRTMRVLSDREADAVDPRKISAFFSSPAGQEVLSADKLWRELKFSLLIPSEEIPGCPPGEEILLQGVVDCCYEKDGKLTIVDFKTDYVTDETIAQRAEFYRGQLSAYHTAMARIMKKPVARSVLYFITAGKTVEL